MENILEHFKRCAEKVEQKIESRDPKKSRGEDVGMGADGTPTKSIDLEAETTAIEYFKGNTNYSILSEEKGIVEQEKEGFIVMDPIDGTTNSLLDIPFFCISLAFTPSDLSEVKVGYVRNLHTGTEYHAVKGEGSYKNGQRLHPECERVESDLFSVYLGKRAVPESFDIASKGRRIRSLGSAALEICMVAEGTSDLYYHRTPEEKRSLRLIDIAAATLILREVGGEVYNKDLKRLNMGIDTTERKDVIAIYDDRFKEMLMSATPP